MLDILNTLNPFKKQKLTITATKPSKGKGANKFEAMFNPPQYSVTRRIKWITQNGNTPQSSAPSAASGTDIGAAIGAVAGAAGTPNAASKASEGPVFGGLEYGDIALKLILDGTGVSESAFSTGFGFKIKKVQKRVEEFLEVCYYISEEIHEPKPVSLKWGDGLQFNAYLDSVNISYTLFDAAGNALRAELDAIFKILPGPVKLASPDLTHTREVHEGDTLPLLSKEIYGSSRYYLFIAEANKLDDFRNLKPGTKLYFPPLENQI